MNTDESLVSLQDRAIKLVLKQFTGKKPRYGQFPVHPATHSLRVGSDLLKYGFPLDTVLGGYCHDLEEDTGINPGIISRDFGLMVTVYMQMCSLPKFNGDHCDESENDLFRRVEFFTHETGDTGPLAIKCVDSMDSIRGAKYCPPDWAPKLLKRAKRWLSFAYPLLTENYRELILDFEEVIRRENLRLSF